MKMMLAVLGMLAGVGTAFAQTGPAPQPPIGPTEHDCRAGYRADMPWTAPEFAKACADLAQRRKP